MKPKKSKKDKIITGRIPTPLFDRYAETAARLHVSQSDLMQEAIAAFVELAEKNDYRIAWPPEVSFTHAVVLAASTKPQKGI